MDIDIAILQKAFLALTRDLGSLDDLNAEMRNTLVNIYYRFHLVGDNLSDPAAALNLNGHDAPSLFNNFVEGVWRVTGEYEAAAPLVRSIREVQRQEPQLFDYLQTHFLDTFKYRIANVNDKSEISRASERPFCNVDEIPNLYEQLTQFQRP
jgi:hypothetical protein